MGSDEPLHILIIESKSGLSQRITVLLTEKGYDTTLCESFSAARRLMENEVLPPFCLIMCCYRIPGESGEDFLKDIARQYPAIPRLLIADASDLYSIVGAINSAGIFSCLSVPFKNDDLLRHVEKGLEQYLAIKKREHLKRVSENQNKQMFLLANKLKRKSEQKVLRIKDKKQKIHELELKINMTRDRNMDQPDIEDASLLNILKEKGIPFTPERLYAEFQHMAHFVKNTLDTIIKKHPQEATDLPPVLSENNPHQENERAVTNHLLSLFFVAIYRRLLKQKGGVLSPAVPIETCLELSVSENNLKAYLKLKKWEKGVLTLKSIKRFLYENDIFVGIKNDHIIETWIENVSPEAHPFMIAEGKAPVAPKHAEIKYYFPTDFLGAGKMNTDGSIDFRERGKTPFVSKDTFLCEKIPAVPGEPGIDVRGFDIPVVSPPDLPFGAGPGAIISEDGERIYAGVDGQPYLDVMGKVSVLPELRIKGDIGYQTGNINFDGNVHVEGVVKQGFSVKCASLTAGEIEAAGAIDLSGDLTVSAGILNAENIRVTGNVYARYINRSTIDAFGDIVVVKEIIDSRIRLSGAFVIEGGTIISSEIAAKMGISAGNIGTDVSKPSTLWVGVDKYIESLTNEIEAAIKKDTHTYERIKHQIEILEEEYESLHGIISGYSFAQDKYQAELEKAEKLLEELQSSGNMTAYQKIKRQITTLKENAEKAEAGIHQGFEKQDALTLEMEQLNETLHLLHISILDQTQKKKVYEDFSQKEPPVAEVRVIKRLMPGTVILGPHSKLTIQSSISKCRIMEIENKKPATNEIIFHEMKMIPY